MKYILFLTLVFTNFYAFSQSKISDSYYVTNANDTIKCTIPVPLSLFGRLDLGQVSQRVTLTENSEKKKFKPKEIKAFIISYKDSTYKFVSLEGEKRFCQELINGGKISLYNTFSNNLYDGSTVITAMAIKDSEKAYITFLNQKKKITNLIADCPELLKEWNEEKYTPKQKEEVFMLYNKLMAGK